MKPYILHLPEGCRYSVLPCTLNQIMWILQTSPIALSTLDWMTAKNAPKRAPMLAARINTTTRQEQHRCGCLAQHPFGFAGPSVTFLISVPWWLCSSESDILWDTASPRFFSQFSHQWPSSRYYIIPAPHPCSCPIVAKKIRWSGRVHMRMRTISMQARRSGQAIPVLQCSLFRTDYAPINVMPHLPQVGPGWGHIGVLHQVISKVLTLGETPRFKVPYCR